MNYQNLLQSLLQAKYLISVTGSLSAISVFKILSNVYPKEY